MHTLVLQQGSLYTKCLATLTAPVRLLPSVHSLVAPQDGAMVEGFPTQGTHVRSLPGVDPLVLDEV